MALLSRKDAEESRHPSGRWGEAWPHTSTGVPGTECPRSDRGPGLCPHSRPVGAEHLGLELQPCAVPSGAHVRDRTIFKLLPSAQAEGGRGQRRRQRGTHVAHWAHPRRRCREGEDGPSCQETAGSDRLETSSSKSAQSRCLHGIPVPARQNAILTGTDWASIATMTLSFRTVAVGHVLSHVCGHHTS